MMNSTDKCNVFRMNSSGYHFTKEEAQFYERIIVNVRVSVACVSFLGCVFVIALIWLFKKYKFFAQRLILYISVSALLSSIAYLLGRVDYEYSSTITQHFCVFQGFILLYTDWTVLMAFLCVTFNLFLQIFGRRNGRKLELVYLVVMFLAPLPISCIPFARSSFGLSGFWCWIRNKQDDCSNFRFGTILQFAVWYIPLYVLILTLFIMYLAIVIKTKLQAKQWQGTYDPSLERRKLRLQMEVKPLLWYPVIFFIINLLPFINRLNYTISGYPHFSLYLLHVISAPLAGVLVVLLYAVDRDTLRRLNWRTIRASLLYRNTDDFVREYPVVQDMEEKCEREVLIQPNSYESDIIKTD